MNSVPIAVLLSELQVHFDEFVINIVQLGTSRGCDTNLYDSCKDAEAHGTSAVEADSATACGHVPDENYEEAEEVGVHEKDTCIFYRPPEFFEAHPTTAFCGDRDQAHTHP